MAIIALVDCESFYCTAESVFFPRALTEPTVVLSNNDGCIIAANRKAKALGIGMMCNPYHEAKATIEKHGVHVFSSNYTLYDDLSKRVMQILWTYSPTLEIYSIDEAFLDLTNIHGINLTEYAKKIRKEVYKKTGIVVRVGIASSKVLAKMANKLAKNNAEGICVLENIEQTDAALKSYPVENIWGIGRASAAKLNLIKVRSSYDLKVFPDHNLIQKLLTKVGRKIQDELSGINCMELQDFFADKKIIGNSRSFGIPVYLKKDLSEAVATFTTYCAERLRKQNSVCYGITVSVETNPFKEVPQYFNHQSISFSMGTSDTFKLVNEALNLLGQIYRGGYEYKRAGVLLNYIVPQNENQLDLFQKTTDNELLNQTLDNINKKFGPKTVKSLSCGITHEWRTRAAMKSKHYSTDWNEAFLIKVY